MSIRFLAVSAFGVLLAAVPMGYAQQAQQGDQRPPWVEDGDTRPAEEAYKNIKVFTGLPANRLKAVMNTWKNSLGVECTFCHTRGEWESDSIEEKGFAREMHKLTADLTKNYFGGKEEVTCYTCHRGEKHPAKRLPAAPVQRQARPVAP
ncbi:MAG: c-type cytochrome [Bryobacterales bacterium]|nr:c-type cytochrome [Bryobacterales bacterium]